MIPLDSRFRGNERNGILTQADRERAYFDWNATAPLREAARQALQEALAVSGNPSSIHAEGRSARRLVEDALAELDFSALAPGDRN